MYGEHGFVRGDLVAHLTIANCQASVFHVSWHTGKGRRASGAAWRRMAAFCRSLGSVGQNVPVPSHGQWYLGNGAGGRSDGNSGLQSNRLYLSYGRIALPQPELSGASCKRSCKAGNTDP